MKIHVTDNEMLKETIRNQLCDNDGYCPCVVDSRGKVQYKCICEDFLLNTPAGQSCHCGLYIKDNE